MVDKAAKKAIKQKKVKKKNRKSIEININHISPFFNLFFLKMMIKALFIKKLYIEWKDNWYRKTEYYIFYKIVLIPLRKILHLIDKLSKSISLLMIQIKIGKIDLKKFFYEQNIPILNNIEYVYKKKKE